MSDNITLRKEGFMDVTIRKGHAGGYEMLTYTRVDGSEVWTKITFTDEQIEKQIEMYQVKEEITNVHA